MSGKPFRVSYSNSATGATVQNERPRLVHSADGRSMALFLGDAPIAAVPASTPVATLWLNARSQVAARKVLSN